MSTTLRLILAQCNFSLGDIQANTQQILELAERAYKTKQADAIVFPELSLTGYPPEDLLFRFDFYSQIDVALSLLEQAKLPIDIIIGYPVQTKQGNYNAACCIRNGKRIAIYYKQSLPNYAVFDEKRFFIPGNAPCVIDIKGIPVALTICEDLWSPEPLAQAKANGAQLALCLNASPFHFSKDTERKTVLFERARETGLPILYVNWVGAQDELIFDGGSMVVDAEGTVCQQANFFEECLMPVDITLGTTLSIKPQTVPTIHTEESLIYKALVTAVKNYFEKNHAKGALIGLSGGIDSALTTAIAVDALGKDNVEVVLMPSRYTSDMSNEDAIEMAKRLGINHSIVSIENIVNAYHENLEHWLTDAPPITAQNIQSRARGGILMALSNATGKLVLATGNKSEVAVGFSTLYGDTVGAYAILKDVVKTRVYRLAKWRNQQNEVIPTRIIERPPSAELAPDQLDEHSLAPYDILDKIIAYYVEEALGVQEIIAKGLPKQAVIDTIKLIDRNEFKRQQMPPGARITSKAFGRDRRYPITSGFTSDLQV